MKYQEISPPLVDDFLYICDDTYIRDEMLAMERSLLKTVGFDLGIPLSYSFLRRYAQVCNVVFHTVIFYSVPQCLLQCSHCKRCT